MTQQVPVASLAATARGWTGRAGERSCHTAGACGNMGCFLAPSIAFRHLPPNSARTGYASDGALFISAQLSTDGLGAGLA